MLCFFQSSSTAQLRELDTIYIIDYAHVKCNGRNLSKRAFKNLAPISELVLPILYF